MRALMALAFKDIKILFRDRMGFFFTIIYPLVVAILFGSMYSGQSASKPRRIPLAIADEDSTFESRALVDSLKAMEELFVIETSKQDGYEKVRLAKAVGCVVIKKGFGKASKNIFWGDPPAVDLAVDPARKPEKAMIEGILLGKASQRFSQFFTNPSLQRERISEARAALDTSKSVPEDIKKSLMGLFDEVDNLTSYQIEHLPDSLLRSGQGEFSSTPLKITHTEISVIRNFPKSAYAVTFPQAASWILIAVTAGFSLMIVTERTQGTLMRLLVSPLPPPRILLGKALACLISTFLVTGSLFLIGYIGFDVIPNSIPLLAFAVVCSSICFVGLLMILSSLGDTPGSVAGVTWATLLIFAAFGGGMVPLIALPNWMRKAGSFSPIKWSILAIEGAVWRNFTFKEMLKPCGILILISALCLFVTFRLLPSSVGYGRNR